MILDQEVEILGNGKTIKHYIDRGYNIKVNQRNLDINFDKDYYKFKDYLNL